MAHARVHDISCPEALSAAVTTADELGAQFIANLAAASHAAWDNRPAIPRGEQGPAVTAAVALLTDKLGLGEQIRSPHSS
ncbi:MAG TPA: hypothetical protein VMY99_04025 [Nevskiaceae bacterium]|nr:hypothetical protein [Nevskiaceae bacterium]